MFKRNRNIIKKTPRDPKTGYFSYCFFQGQNDMKKIWKKNYASNKC